MGLRLAFSQHSRNEAKMAVLQFNAISGSSDIFSIQGHGTSFQLIRIKTAKTIAAAVVTVNAIGSNMGL